jgi:chloride channel 3/4/5
MLGAAGGLVGTLLLKLMVKWAHFRLNSPIARHPIREAALVSFLSASATYLSTFLRMDTTDLLAALYSDCKYQTNRCLTSLNHCPLTLNPKLAESLTLNPKP